ncbi:MAG: arsenite methyltransferase [Bacteroidota bacterium]|nr:arsenite methyltransferase [Bacteroidota bacterium]
MEHTEATRLKELVKEKYSEIANQSKETNETSCCGAGACCDTMDYTIMSEEYNKLEGYNPDADLGLGCGLPTEFAQIKEGDTVVDLGSGAGNDCFVARAITGETGKVIGVDMTEGMIAKAKANAEKLDFKNVEFRLGDIEDLPMAANKADVVVSNCVLNLVPNKELAFKEVFRVLKPKGHFSISDVVLKGELPDGIRKEAEMYAGCVAGALQKETYLNIIHQTGFKNIVLQKEKAIHIPDAILLNYLSPDELADYKASGKGVYSITVYAEKPDTNCCTPGTGCC